MKKLVIVSLDMMIALPIVSFAFMLIFSSISGSQSYLQKAAGFQSRDLAEIEVSQQIAGAIDGNTIGYSSALQLAANLSSRTGLFSEITSSPQNCSYPSLCRIITISGFAYILRLSYENSS